MPMERGLPARLALEDAAYFLQRAGIDSPEPDARILMAHVLGVPLTRLDLLLSRPLSTGARSMFGASVDERAGRRPLAYITGETEFMGLRLACDERALVPRPETEILVERVLELPAGSAPVIADVGTGTGAIGLSLAASLPEARVILTDASPDALALARENCERLNLADRVTLLEGRDLAPLVDEGAAEDITCVVSNPPYIPSGDVAALQPEVAEHEPSVAWLGEGAEGLGFYERVIPRCATSLPRLELAAFEFGIGQGPRVAEICLGAFPAWDISIIEDLSGIERVVIAQADRPHADG